MSRQTSQPLIWLARIFLPGYPFTFVVYKQIAADNAAIVTEAFLHSWAGA
jgi:hypothetical protein